VAKSLPPSGLSFDSIIRAEYTDDPEHFPAHTIQDSVAHIEALFTRQEDDND